MLIAIINHENGSLGITVALGIFFPPSREFSKTHENGIPVLPKMV
jgi:hypothetical protein